MRHYKGERAIPAGLWRMGAKRRADEAIERIIQARKKAEAEKKSTPDEGVQGSSDGQSS